MEVLFARSRMPIPASIPLQYLHGSEGLVKGSRPRSPLASHRVLTLRRYLRALCTFLPVSGVGNRYPAVSQCQEPRPPSMPGPAALAPVAHSVLVHRFSNSGESCCEQQPSGQTKANLG